MDVKNHGNNFQKNLQYEKFEKTIVTIFKTFEILKI